MSKINVKSALGTSSLPKLKKKTSLKSEKKYTNHRPAEYHHVLKERKPLSTRRARESNLGPLVYEASVLQTELSFWMKNWEKIMTIYIWFIVQQMYVSLTYPFNIVQHTLSHIVEQCKLDSLATSDNIVWSTVTSYWSNNVRQFDPSLRETSSCTLDSFQNVLLPNEKAYPYEIWSVNRILYWSLSKNVWQLNLK